MKLGDVIKKNSAVVVTLTTGREIFLNYPDSTHEIEYLDDEWQQLGFITKVAGGRRKGEKAIMIVPYTAIQSVTVSDGA